MQIFRAGTWTDAAGITRSWSEGDVAAMAAAYDPDASEAPLVVGHPADDAPAYGWVARLTATDGVLDAEPHLVDPDFAALVAAGRYRRVSAAFYLPDAPANPKPGTWYLRHVGFLGAQPPAVKGLRAAALHGDASDAVTVTLALSEPTQTRLEEVPPMADTDTAALPTEPADTPIDRDEAQRELIIARAKLAADAAALAAERAAFAAERELARATAVIESHVKAGRVLPADAAALAQFTAALDGTAEVAAFAETGGSAGASARAWFEAWLARQPVRVEFRELTPGGGEPGGPLTAQSLAERGREIAAEATAKGRHLHVADAVRQAAKEAAR
jgi:hypothetical protein